MEAEVFDLTLATTYVETKCICQNLKHANHNVRGQKHPWIPASEYRNFQMRQQNVPKTMLPMQDMTWIISVGSIAPSFRSQVQRQGYYRGSPWGDKPPEEMQVLDLSAHLGTPATLVDLASIWRFYDEWVHWKLHFFQVCCVKPGEWLATGCFFLGD